MSKLCFIDIETTGTDRLIHEIHQISGIIVIDDKIREVFDFKIRPSEKCVYDPEALQINQLTVEDLQSSDRLSHRQAYQQFLNIMCKYVNKYNKSDKMFFVGYNAHFDKERMYDWFISNGDNYFFSLFWGNHIDIMVLATICLMDERPKMNDFKLTTVAKYLNIVVPEDVKLPDGANINDKQAHDAIFDILLTKAIYDYMRNLNTQAKISSEENTLADIGAAFLPQSTATLTDNIQVPEKKKPIGKSGYPVLDWDSTFPFKKYRGYTVKEIFDVDVQYLKWCIDNTSIELLPEIVDDIRLYAAKAEDEEQSKRNRLTGLNDKVIDHFIDNEYFDYSF